MNPINLYLWSRSLVYFCFQSCIVWHMSCTPSRFPVSIPFTKFIWNVFNSRPGIAFILAIAFPQLPRFLFMTNWVITRDCFLITTLRMTSMLRSLINKNECRASFSVLQPFSHAPVHIIMVRSMWVWRMCLISARLSHRSQQRESRADCLYGRKSLVMIPSEGRIYDDWYCAFPLFLHKIFSHPSFHPLISRTIHGHLWGTKTRWSL